MAASVSERYDLAGREVVNVASRRELERKQVLTLPSLSIESAWHLQSGAHAAAPERGAAIDAEVSRLERPR